MRAYLPFTLFLICCNSQLDICSSGDCTWDDPSTNRIRVCTNTATSCTITIRNAYNGGAIYSAAPNTNIICQKMNGCEQGEYHCGNVLPPFAATYGLTMNNFTGPITNCNFDCTNPNIDNCDNANFYCTGNVQQCNLNAAAV
eukprot:825866_1